MSSQASSVAKVVHIVDGFNVAINKGEADDVKIGDIYLIYSLGPELTDPDSGVSLGVLEIVRGRAVVRHVQERLSTLESIEHEDIPGKKKVIKREGNASVFSSALGIPRVEEVVEGGERVQVKLTAQVGDSAKIVLKK